MKKSILSLILFGAVLSAAPVSVTLLDGGKPVAYDSTGYNNVGPYNLTVNGVATPAMCMDDFIETNIKQHWSANVTAVTSASLSSTILGDSGETIYGEHYTSSQIYTAEAYLFSLITKPSADRADIQEAAWFIMDPSSKLNTTYLSLPGVQNYLELAADNYQTFNASGYTIITDTSKRDAQEFMAADPTPEPASLALVGGAFLAAGFIRLRRSKKSASRAPACIGVD